MHLNSILIKVKPHLAIREEEMEANEAPEPFHNRGMQTRWNTEQLIHGLQQLIRPDVLAKSSLVLVHDDKLHRREGHKEIDQTIT